MQSFALFLLFELRNRKGRKRMRIRWTDDCVEEGKELSFTYTGDYDEKGIFIPTSIVFTTGREFMDYDGEINMSAFENIEEIKKWQTAVCDKLMIDGYYDFRPDEAAGRIILY